MMAQRKAVEVYQIMKDHGRFEYRVYQHEGWECLDCRLKWVAGDYTRQKNLAQTHGAERLHAVLPWGCWIEKEAQDD